MLSFAEPGWLLLAPLPFVAAAVALRRLAPALRYSSLDLARGLPRGRARRAVYGPPVLRVAALILLLMAAAGPRVPDLTTRLPAEGVSIMLALDVSGSMATRDFPTAAGGVTSRLDAARAAYKLFLLGGTAAGETLPGRPNDVVGLVAFAAVPRTVCPLTFNHAVLTELLDAQEPRSGLDAGTNVGDAITEALLRLDTPGPRRKVLVLLSDGEQNAAAGDPGAALRPRQAANLAKSLGITIDTIDCGGTPSGVGEEQRAAGREVLAAVARITGGRSYEADNAEELVAACRAIDALERQPLETFRTRRYRPLGRGFALAAVCCLTVMAVLNATVWRVQA